jgi:hypothetical protein
MGPSAAAAGLGGGYGYGADVGGWPLSLALRAFPLPLGERDLGWRMGVDRWGWWLRLFEDASYEVAGVVVGTGTGFVPKRLVM